jgi:hypothetical protein
VGLSITTDSNVVEGNFIGTNATGTAAVGNRNAGISIGGEPDIGSDNTIGGTIATARNVISGNGGDGVSLGTSGSDNVIEGNDIGTDVTGTKALANKSDGVGIGNSLAADTIGGNTVGAGNVISGNDGDGVVLDDSDVLVAGNDIGTEATGSQAVPNGGDGVQTGNVLTIRLAEQSPRRETSSRATRNTVRPSPAVTR